jgi:exodeoxyribonuclease-3
MLRLYSWNVNGIRAAQKKGFLDWLLAVKPDVLCVQETKASPEQLDSSLLSPNGYQVYWASAERKGYSGVALFSRHKPKSVEIGIGDEQFDREGRTIIAEFEHFVLLTAYFPNGSRDHSRVPYKMAFKQTFLERCNTLRQAGKPNIFCGDVNTAHQEIDLANPASNRNHTGFLPEERRWIDSVLEAGYIDTFRAEHPGLEGAYSWWAYWGNARPRNIGWRLDYFFVSSDLQKRILEAAILSDVMGSDHCPVSLVVDFD